MGFLLRQPTGHWLADLYIKNPTHFSSYLRRVIASWTTQEKVNMKHILPVCAWVPHVDDTRPDSMPVHPQMDPADDTKTESTPVDATMGPADDSKTVYPS